LKGKDEEESEPNNDGKTIDSYHSNGDSFVHTKVGIILPESMINDASEIGDLKK
jgi:hypothetical protein